MESTEWSPLDVLHPVAIRDADGLHLVDGAGPRHHSQTLECRTRDRARASRRASVGKQAPDLASVAGTGHGFRLAQLATLLFFRPGRSAETLCADMDPANPWSLSTLNARMQGLRRSLGSDPDGDPYVPRRKSG
ncbi:hypothetical protein [Streptomyces rochei]|uniref:Uncharacterized protein n=1 Tax=Streptomyces rochei TaxID=1928 RepID=A0ABW7E864_STRRO